ncbi:MAG: 5-formyltetrahydrofolate cyclo-ligase [Sulfurimonas sp.]|jgi:5-formyltetrahydrofolate cyclo-ligase|uniref:5-formyltetrahydrofolate cyclo-ligase n=1 Tax=Sulfurimonas sp. TaxID=2022749 RepID=UPI0039E32617
MTLTKAQFREKSLDRLRKLSPHNRLYRDSLVNAKLLNELKNVRNKSILIYYPLENEVDLVKVIKNIRRYNDIYLPFMEQQSFKMVKFRLPLHKKKFGIFEAGNSLRKINTIDIAIVPAIGVDVNLQRIGFGKGMYDRFFASLQKKPYTIFIQADECYTKEKVCDAYDISCDVLLTPKTIRRK